MKVRKYGNFGIKSERQGNANSVIGGEGDGLEKALIM